MVRKPEKIEVHEASIAAARFGYTHAAPTAAAEARRVAEVKAGARKDQQ